MNFKLALSLLAPAPFLVVHAKETNLRAVEKHQSLPQERELNKKFWVGGYEEKLKQCTGAICAVHGDPHVVTCDGMPYDCQGHGIFNIMDNEMYSVQGHFVDVPKPGHLNMAPAASWLSDVAIDFKANPDVPVIQIGYGDIGGGYDGFPSEKGCYRTKMFAPYKNSGGHYGSNMIHRALEVESVYACRKACQEFDGCAKFNFFANGRCDMMNNDDVPLIDQPGSWSLNLAGTLESDCGKEHDPLEYRNGKEQFYHGSIGGNKRQKCPLLLHLDGELQDISRWAHNQKGYIVGDKDSDFHIEIFHSDLYIRNRLPTGELTEIKMVHAGKGPGEQWGCNWGFYVCLPEAGASLVKDSLGLMGTIDDDTSNDWMDINGTTIPIQNHREDFRSNHNYLRSFYQESYDYCKDNWCVSQKDSLMTYPGEWTYEDMKCEDEPFIDFDIDNPACVLNAETIEERCEGTPPLLQHACELDCCLGGCDDFQDSVDVIGDLITNGGGGDENQNEIPNHDQCNETGEFLKTGDTVCPGANIVEVLHTSGSYDGDLPDASEIIYGIIPNVEHHDEVTEAHVKFRVNNPFGGSVADVYVRHERNTHSSFLDLVCDKKLGVESGCNTTAEKIEAVCRSYPGYSPYATFSVYFSSDAFHATDTDVDKCCHADVSGKGVIAYTFRIQCVCPDDSSTE